MSDRYSGITGAIIEASDIARDESVSYAIAMEIQEQRSAHRLQEYLDASQEIESNVIYGVDFINKKPKGETRAL